MLLMNETLENNVKFDEKISINPFVNMQILFRNTTFTLLA